MTPIDLEAELQRLSDEAAQVLASDPAAAAEALQRAHTLALDQGEVETAAGLSTLLARCWSLRSSIVRSLHYARRAVREAPDSYASHYTLGQFYEKAAIGASRARNTGRAAILYSAAGREFGAAAAARATRTVESYARAVDASLREAEGRKDPRGGSGGPR